MNDQQFAECTKIVARMFPRTNAEDGIKEVKRMISVGHKITTECATIESTVWGWRILQPYGKCSQLILLEYLASLDDAIQVCEAFKMTCKVSDTEDPDPL